VFLSVFNAFFLNGKINNEKLSLPFNTRAIVVSMIKVCIEIMPIHTENRKKKGRKPLKKVAKGCIMF